jgi:hypothetical protein
MVVTYAKQPTGLTRLPRAGRASRLLLAAAVGSFLFTSRVPAAERLQYNRDIRPILSENCFPCQGPDKNKRKGKLRLDIREEALKPAKSDAIAIVPGKPEESELVKRLFTSDPDELMPPAESHKTLTAAQKETLKRWIAEGAQYQAHWAYLTPTRPAVARVKNPKWARNEIDAFIPAELEKRNIAPSPEADRRTLLRRLSLDLIGLPPTPAEVESFARDRSARAYEKQVDRLLDSPHYGERMAVPWLDVVRFADTVGYHGDQNANVFPYRDYVIDAFNRNKPFDEFTIEQLAGDLLPRATVEQRIATGFNRLNMVTREGGAQPKEYLAKYAADRVRTVGRTWLGSTLGCAECHDHKFDPFTSRDFYSLAAFFADVKQWGVYQDYGYTPNPDLRTWSNDHPFPPELEVESPYLQRRIGRLTAKLEEVAIAQVDAMKQDKSKRGAFEAWCREAKTFLERNPTGWLTPPPTLVSTNTNAAVTASGELLVSGERKDGEFRLRLAPEGGWVAAVRLDLLPGQSGAITRGGGAAWVRLSVALASATNGEATKLEFHHAEATHREPRYANGYEIIGVTDAWRTSGKREHEPQSAVYVLNQPRRVQAGDTLLVTLKSDSLARVRVSTTPFAAANPLESGARPALVEALAKLGFKSAAPTADTFGGLPRQPSMTPPVDSKGAPHLVTGEIEARPGTSPVDQKLTRERARRLLAATWLLSTEADPAARERAHELNREILECRNGRSPTLITESWKRVPTRVLPRGNWQDETGPLVSPAPPRFLPQASLPTDRTFTRLDLAKWLVAPENPLTARVFVNRLWKQFFGSALSAQVDDLGAQGESPSHPELLDWLSVEFRESGWDIKHLVRLLVRSATYRQCSNLRPELRDLDPNNRLLASQTPRRLEAEFVRDNALSIAGLINLDLGGPSAFPYQPAGYYVNLQFPDRDYVPNRDERQYRRGLYAHWQRTFLQPMLANFDAPAREECTAHRVVSNTPQQALTLLNDPTFVEASRVFAERLLARKKLNDEERLDLAFRLTLARPVKRTELKSLTAFLAAQREHYGASSEETPKLLRVGNAPPPKERDDAEVAAWTQVARVVLNLQETITRY